MEYLIYGLVFFSGFSGLVYEVVWHRYLGVLLGAQARATCIVLAIFLGGLGWGYYAFGKWSRTRSWNLVRAYAIVELGIGVWALLFPFLFHYALPFTSSLYHSLGVNNLAIDFLISAALIFIPTFLMGGTLPLLTQALSQDVESASRTHAKIYGFNTLGACLGCALAGYVLIPSTTLPHVLMIGGLVNLIVAVGFATIAPKFRPQIGTPRPADKQKLTAEVKAVLTVGLLSGFYLTTLETVFVRLVGLSSGSSNYNFTLIVTIFILSLGIGSLFAKRINGTRAMDLAWNQTIAAASLLLLYLLTNLWPYITHLIRISLRDTGENFAIYEALLAISFAAQLMLPIALAGLTLPLCFHLLKDKRDNLGEKVGLLYTVNTVGSVGGATLGGYYLLNFLNLDGLFKLCIFLCLGSSLVIAWRFRRAHDWQKLAGLAVVVFIGVILAPGFNRDNFIQPFRQPNPISGVSYEGPSAFGRFLARTTKYLFYKDGPNTSVGVGAAVYKGKELSRSIFINGKSDGNTRGDLFTTLMMAHLPALLAEKLNHVCVVGFGTGVTAGTFLEYLDLERIDVVEISNTVIESAKYFDPYDNHVTSNPRIHFNEMDAFRFLEGSDSKFDAIVSEPSNPWVAGIENLFSVEFYAMAHRKLEAGGVFVQWIHTYSFNDDLFRMVLKTMGTSFPQISVFQLKGGDLALVGYTESITAEHLQRAKVRLDRHLLAKASLEQAGIHQFESVLALELIPPSVVKKLAEGAEIQSLESPKLSNEAAKAFFVNSMAKINDLRRAAPGYLPAMKEALLSIYLDQKVPPPAMVKSFRQSFCDDTPSKNSGLCEETLALSRALDATYDPDLYYEEVLPRRDMASLNGHHANPNPKAFGPLDLAEIYRIFETYKKYSSPLAHFPTELLVGRTDGCLKTISQSSSLYGECLLQKILMLELTDLSPNEYLKTVDRYTSWFPTLNPGVADYARLKEAKEILGKVMGFKTH
jgi:spermidine synthase